MSDDEVLACPDCDRTPVVANAPGGRSHGTSEKYRCARCGWKGDEPRRRPSRGDPDLRADSVAAKLAEADSLDELVTDGGVPSAVEDDRDALEELVDTAKSDFERLVKCGGNWEGDDVVDDLLRTISSAEKAINEAEDLSRNELEERLHEARMEEYRDVKELVEELDQDADEFMTDGGVDRLDGEIYQIERLSDEPRGSEPASADCGAYRDLYGPFDLDGRVSEGGDMVCSGCAEDRGADLTHCTCGTSSPREMTCPGCGDYLGGEGCVY